MTTMGETNAGWGVCGFTSCLYAMYDLNPTARRYLINAPQAWSVLYEIEEYLEILKQNGDTRLLSLIEGFTRSFGGQYSNFSVDTYIAYIRSSWDKYATANSGDLNKKVKDDSKFSIGMPPDAVVDYLKRMWKRDAKFQFTSSPADGILGVRDPNDKNMWMYGGLRHYLYQKGNKIYSWGKSFGSVLEAGRDFAARDYAVCCTITF
jgi:hypothetical protein